jgi:integrase/recombinase XerD
MKKLDRPRATGPLALYAEGFRSELLAQGYSPSTASEHLSLIGKLSPWLDTRGLEPSELDAEAIEEFLADRRAEGLTRRATPRAFVPLLGYLQGLGVVKEATLPVPANLTERLLGAFVDYLSVERALAPETIAGYRHFAELFLTACAPEAEESCDLDRLGAGHINAFLLAERTRRGVGSTKNATTALRVLMRFLYLEGYTAASLVDSIPRAVPWRDSGRSRALAPEQVNRLLRSCDRRTVVGRRDLAILTVLARLGLRRGEVASLRLDDVNWRAGEIAVLGKGGRRDRLPLPADVGEALADYCRRGRPRNGHRAVFLQVYAPHGPLLPNAVSSVVVAACRRAGIERVGAHRLRHSAATAMRRAGAPLFEIGQVLRHRSTTSSALYAKDDLSALASIARPWPGATR